MFVRPQHILKNFHMFLEGSSLSLEHPTSAPQTLGLLSSSYAFCCMKYHAMNSWFKHGACEDKSTAAEMTWLGLRLEGAKIGAAPFLTLRQLRLAGLAGYFRGNRLCRPCNLKPGCFVGPQWWIEDIISANLSVVSLSDWIQTATSQQLECKQTSADDQKPCR